jgi:tripartite-type tricarboxylate transporter receptor subunit TctC
VNVIPGWPGRFLRMLQSAVLVAAVACAVQSAQAQDRYPSRAVRIVVPYAAGGPGDIHARAFSGALAEELGQSVIVDNRSGADGATGTEQAARAAPDGYTVLQVVSTQIINMALKGRERIRYDLLRDFVPVVRTAEVGLVLVSPASSPVRSVAELIALAKSRPNGLVYGSGATGSVGHLSAELFNRATGVSAMHVPYKGTGAAIPDLMAGRLDFFFLTQLEAVGAVKGGHLRALAVTAPQRLAVFPETPTMAELGFKGLEAKISFGFMVPLNTPAPIRQALHDAVLKAMVAPSVRKALQSLGATPSPGGPDELGATIRAELEGWGKVIHAANITAD